MYKADRVIVRKLKEYDPHLSLSWNNEKGFFELWREMAHGKRLITPVTLSIYTPHAPRTYCEPDERLLWWLYEADSWAHGGAHKHALAADRRWVNWIKQTDQKQIEDYRDRAKDIYNLATGFFATKHKSKNTGRPTWNKAPRATWSRPDIQATSSNRLYSRSTANAKRFGFQR